MAKKPKPCKPKPKELLFRFLRSDGRIHEVYAPADVVRSYRAETPNPAQLITPIHIK